MKKIKYLLGFLVVGVGLFINQSFSAGSLFIDYQSQSNKNFDFVFTTNIGIHSPYNNLYDYFSSNLLLTHLSNGYYYRPDTYNSYNILDFNNYSYTGHYFLYSTSFPVYFNSGKLGFIRAYDESNPLNNTYYYYRLAGGGVGFSSADSISSLGGNNYLHILGSDLGDNCFSYNSVINGTCDSIWFNYHGLRENSSNYYTITDQGPLYDSRIDGVDLPKGGVAYSIYNTYSFVAYNSGNNSVLPRTVYRKNQNTVNYLDGVFFTRLNNSQPVLTGETFSIISFYGTGNEFASGYIDSGVVLYSLYVCPYNAQSIYQCSFSKGGYLMDGSSNVSYSSFFYSNLYGTSSPKIINGYNLSSFSITFHSLVSTNNTSFTYILGSNEGFNVLDGITPPDDDNPSIDEESPFGIFGGDSLFYYCNVNQNTRDSPFCFNPDGSLKSDEELKNCYLKKYANLETGTGSTEFFCIDDHSIIQNIDIKLEGSGSVFVPCESDLCSFSSDFGNLGLTSYSVDYFDNYLNTTGLFFKCPWHYDNNLTIWPKLITLLNGVDILLPINCGIAGFSNGKNLFTFENSGHFIPNGPLLNFEGENRILLYYFFDIIISIGIVIFVGKIFYLFHK